MSELTEKEFEAILALNADYRHAMFKRVVAEQGGFYLLVDKDGPLVLNDTECDEDNNLYSILPVWSHEKLASEYAKDNGHESMKPQFVTLNAWNNQWVPKLQEQENVLIGFMIVKDKDFAVDDPQPL